MAATYVIVVKKITWKALSYCELNSIGDASFMRDLLARKLRKKGRERSRLEASDSEFLDALTCMSDD